jgi:DNA-directed RNA polymerase specialized sigma24 family protein
VRENTLRRLLEMLDPDPASAALEYKRLHERVSRYFEWNSVEDPTALADEAMDRLADRASRSDVEEGAPIQNASAFLLGVARLLLQEDLRRRQKKVVAAREWSAREHTSGNEAEIMDRALAHCLAGMPADRRTLLEQYYAHSGSEKIQRHQKLAQDLGPTLNALRNRASRARRELEEEIRAYLDRQAK